MLTKKSLVAALVITFCFGIFGTAIAGAINYPPGVISNLDATTAALDAQFEAMATPDKEVNYVRSYAPAGAISNLDHTTAELDAQLQAVAAPDNKEVNYVQCYTPAGVISNLDHTTAELDAKWGC